MSIFGKKYPAEPVHSHCWAFVSSVTEMIGELTRWKIREIRQFDDYAWRRAIEAKGKQWQ